MPANEGEPMQFGCALTDCFDHMRTNGTLK